MKKNKINIFSIIVMVILIIYSLSLVFLLGWAVITSVKEPLLDFRTNVFGLPKSWEFSNYATVFESFYVPVRNSDGIIINIGMARQILNTFVVCFLSGLCATFIPCLVGYVVAKYSYKFSKIIYTVAIVVMALPIIGAEASTLHLLRSLGIYNTYATIIFQRSSFTGLYFFVFEATFRGVSNDFYEAASLDGASDFSIFFRIMLPMVKNTFLTVFMLVFIASWNDYQYPLMYLPSYPNIAYGLFYVSHSTLNKLSTAPMVLAGCVMLVLPILIVFIIFKDKLMGNVSMGGLKE